MLTESEIKCLNISGDLWNEWLKLPIEHPDDTKEFMFHIHSIQKCIEARAGHRLYKQYYEEKLHK